LAFTDILDNNILIFDGAMGTMLQNAGLPADVPPESFNITHPQIVEDIHRAYVNAGADVITANTFGANPFKLSACGYSVEDVISTGITAAKRSGAKFTALDIGPTGQLLEPMGTTTFDEAYDIFARQVIAGTNAGADLIIIETMSDLYETKAAVLAAKENCSLPVIATMSYNAAGRTYTGCDAVGATLTLCGLGVDAVGINCSLGPGEMLPIIETILRHAHVPVIVQANAGLPIVTDGVTSYPTNPDEYAVFAQKTVQMGVGIIGGCCGTSPEYIRAIKNVVSNIKPNPPMPEPCTAAVSGTRTVFFDNSASITIGQIDFCNNTDLQNALRSGDYESIADEAVEQVDDGADILDINIQTDNPDVMCEVIRAVQAACNVPLQITNTGPDVLEAACRIVNGRPIINLADGIKDSAEQLLIIAKKYGALINCPVIDAQRLTRQALDHGIPIHDILVDNPQKR